ncbi:dihydrolipoyl dehydrogenase [Bacillus atrophaeus]|uniref:Dihydrolipoyl dehydrogenase n=1 Tax=Bacillus atrophaeus (strain 1942) TaxID=720555 RepID=A0ABN3ZAN1_BACA1|nr:dihydrolipoyl dehydrogenase [Bacillus atrophaeus]AMR62220.1 dihydrolipoyl dehydrogenase [Bacillus subtilis subsp. globigii]ADP32998.1 dihydrolipoamide dehydrogenase [Bacillus atrophaeus 1942]AIK45819.1 dihydrolipoyl dehydrogenase [Bacillus atrophaeus subsp. globigii]EIM12214.1 dihydrolipoamide dehydrogenase [Bacillus atrophaeus C89]KFK83088.1 dihydrolipoyl dehydrogenase [Bacillus atrophaeus]
MATEYDVVILGGGTGGYVAAIRAAQLGLKTAVVEKEKLGGTCLHKGCIPSKALLRSAEVYKTSREAAQFGVETSDVSLNFEKVQHRKQEIVDKLANGVQHLMKKGKIDVYEGYGRILGPSIFSPMPGTISVERNNGEDNDMLIPKQVIIATGSRPRMLPGLEADGKYILTSDEALQLKELPESIIIVGGGVIGIEWASMLHDFGVKVTVIEYADRILPTDDKDISKEMQNLLAKKGIEIVTGSKVLTDSFTKTDGVSIQAEKDGETVTYSAEKMLISVGRQANVEGIGLENTDILTENGVISVNDTYQTKESHIYAIGDVIGGLQLAHVASREGIIAAEHIAGLEPLPLNPAFVPKCIYSNPEAASVGLTEEEAKQNGYQTKIGKFPFMAIGKALVHGETDGFVKIVADADTDDILGVHMIGPHVTDMISEAGLAKVLDASPWEIGHTIHPHPSLSEAIGEAALAADGKAIHF